MGIRLAVTKTTMAVTSLILMFIYRARRGLGTDGWHADDAWVVTAVSEAGSLRELVDLGFTHPGFNVLLRVLTRGPADVLAFQAIPFAAALLAIGLCVVVVERQSGSTFFAWAAVLPFASSWLLFRYAVAVKPYTVEIAVFAAAMLFCQRTTDVSHRAVIAWLALLAPVVAFDARLSLISAVTAFGLYWGRQLTLRKFGLLTAGHILIAVPLLVFAQSRFSTARLEAWWLSQPGTFDSDNAWFLAPLFQSSRVMNVVWSSTSLVRWGLFAFVVLGAVWGVAKRDAAVTAGTAAFGLSIGLSVLGMAPFGPDSLVLQRIDLWLAPAVLVLGSTGVRVVFALPVAWLRQRVPWWRTGPEPTVQELTDRDRGQRWLVAQSAAFVVIALALGATSGDHRYSGDGLNQQFAFALNQVASSESALLVGPNHNGIELQLASYNPNGVADTYHDPSNMRGIRISLDPAIVRTSEFLANQEMLAGIKRVVTVRLKNADAAQVDELLRSAGFSRTENPQFPAIGIWEPAGRQ